MSADLIKAALHYSQALGWPVFPCRPRTKVPATKHGFKDATTDQKTVRRWWRTHSDYNIGIPTGAPFGDAIDIDGPAGEASLTTIEKDHGALPGGPWQTTGRDDGGRHLLFAASGLPCGSKAVPGLDTRGAGGYIVLAPSVHPSGALYALHDLAAPLLQLPASVVALFGGAQRALTPLDGVAVEVGDFHIRDLLQMADVPAVEIPMGERNDRLFRLACSERQYDASLGAIVAILAATNVALCRPPMPHDEIVRIATSAASYQPAANFRSNLKAERSPKTHEDPRFQKALEAFQSEGRAASFESALADNRLDDVRELIGKAAGCYVERVIQRGRDSPNYYLDLGKGIEVHVGSSILFPRPLAEALAKHRQIDGFNGLRGKDWERVRRGLLGLVVTDDHDECDRVGQVLGWIATILEDLRSENTLDRTWETVRTKNPFVEKGRLFINSSWLRQWLAARRIALDQNQTVARLKEAGCSQVGSGVITARDERSDIQVTARYWSVSI